MAVAPVVVSSIFFLVAIVLAAALGTALIQYYASIVRMRELFKQEIEVSKAVLVVERAYLEESCVNLVLTNRGSSSVIIDEHASVLLDYYQQNGLRKIELLQFGASWFVSRTLAEVTQSPASSLAVELKPGGSAVIRACPSQQMDSSKQVTIVIVSKLGVKAEYVYTPS